jgi:hypothetical protein
MKTTPSPVDRLLRAAAAQPNEPAPEMPFGFDTRVVAQWRASWPADPAEIVRLLRRVVFLAVALIVLASAGAYREFSQSAAAGEEFAIADSAIGGAFDQ